MWYFVLIIFIEKLYLNSKYCISIYVVSRGDSGSALIINKYVQIGIVSYKTADYSLVVYTNVSYFYNWIKRAALKLFCRKSSVRKIN